MNIGGCRACETCFKTGKACSFNDDFNTIAPAIQEADAVVVSTPVYWYSIPSQIKAVIDKLPRRTEWNVFPPLDLIARRFYEPQEIIKIFCFGNSNINHGFQLCFPTCAFPFCVPFRILPFRFFRGFGTLPNKHFSRPDGTPEAGKIRDWVLNPYACYSSPCTYYALEAQNGKLWEKFLKRMENLLSGISDKWGNMSCFAERLDRLSSCASEERMVSSTSPFASRVLIFSFSKTIPIPKSFNSNE